MASQTEILRLLRLVSPYKSSTDKVRLGSNGDGGYVLNDDLAGLEGAFSLGIGQEVSFDLALARLGFPVFQYDPTVNGPPVDHPLFLFRKIGWASKNGPETRSLIGMLEENNLTNSNNLLLKFDVEGAEWHALKGMSEREFGRWRIIVAEFHWFQQLNNPEFFKTAQEVFELLTTRHIVTHIHPNNNAGLTFLEGVVVPNVLEVTFLRRDRGTFVPSRDPIPSSLDYPNAAERPDIILNAFHR